MANNEKKSSDLDKVLSAVSDMFASQNEYLDERFTGLDNRMDGLEGRIDRLDGRMNGLEGQMSKLEVLQGETNRRLEKIEDKLEAVEADIKEIYRMLAGLDKDLVPRRIFDKVVRRLDAVEKELAIIKKRQAA